MKRREERSELREKTTAELHEELRKSRADLFALRFQYASKQLTDTDGIRRARKRIARILTILRQRQRVEGTRV